MSSIPNPLRYGLKFSQQVHPIDVQIDVWRTADTAGFDHIWPFDHLIALGPDPTALIFDGWTVLGAMAAIAEPKPVQRPHPPIWIGSKGERMLRLTARHADVWHSNAATFEEGVALSKALDAACTKAGRDPSAVRRSISMRLTSPEETLQKAKATIAAGFTEILVMIG